MLPRSQDSSDSNRAASAIARIAIVVATAVAVSVPLVYVATTIGEAGKSLDFNAQVKASGLNALISDHPEKWILAENRIKRLLSREPVPFEGEYIEVRDGRGDIVVVIGDKPREPALRRNYPLLDAGRVVGSIFVSASLFDRFASVGVASVVGLLLGALVFLVMSILPLRAVREATEALTAEKERAETTLRSISDAVIAVDASGVCRQANPAWLAIIDADRQESTVGRSVFDLIAAEYRVAFSDLNQRVLAGETAQLQCVVQGLKDRRRWLEMRSTPLLDNGVILNLAVIRDITDRKIAEDEIRALAFYDQLTGLPNRRLLVDRLAHAIAACTRSKRYASVLYLDLDNFKTLNDTRGHDIGDLLLTRVAKRLTASVRLQDTVARFGGDEFVVLLEGLSANSQEALTQTRIVGKKILATLNDVHELMGHEHHVTPSIGATLFNDRADTGEDILKQADLAMYRAKATGRNTMCFFDPGMQAMIAAQAALETGLREALLRGHFQLYYQPQVNHEDRVQGAEVLIRWRHPRRGLIGPAEFIPYSEQSGLILPIGLWVLQTACAQLALWATRSEMAHLTISVNVSSRQLKMPSFVDEVLKVLDDSGADPEQLRLELTESVLADDVEDSITKMRALRARGVRFSLDDFGTGYSSLSYLKRLPLEQLKIDQGFIRDILTDPNDAAIAKMVVALADSLRLSVIGEGVETTGQKDLLASMGCLNYQGYLFAHPMPLDEFERWVRRA